MQNNTEMAEIVSNLSTVTVATSFNKTTTEGGVYPHDIFDLEARKNGAVILHMIGVLYMFIALAIICDEFFVPALEVITSRLKISLDVAGATFMAAGGSAPELFTSVVGVFFAKSDVGVGTIVGSAVFNILFVIGACALVSKKPLELTWWPLFRDCVFYLICLTALIITFTDYQVTLCESLILISLYVLYVIFMANNKKIEAKVKSMLNKSSNNNNVATNGKISPVKDTEVSKSVQAVVKTLKNQDKEKKKNKNSFSMGMIHLIMHTLDPMTEDANGKQVAKLYSNTNGKISNETSETNNSFRNDLHGNDNALRIQEQKKVTAVVCIDQDAEVSANQQTLNHTTLTLQDRNENGHTKPEIKHQNGIANGKDHRLSVDIELESRMASDSSEEEESVPFDMSWPQSNKKRCLYLFILPITLPLSLTLPDVRKPNREKYFLITFAMSILWIGFFTYLMVWWAHQVVETTGMSETVMGLTFLAAGTSVPDLITSVIVARKGRGDMAVSSSVGSNIFDVTIGLPLPWAMATLIRLGDTVKVESNGLFCSVLLLAIMLFMVVTSIACNSWKMTKKLGVGLFLLYLVFLVSSLLLELGYVACPVQC